jgi:hypothetical protein
MAEVLCIEVELRAKLGVSGDRGVWIGSRLFRVLNALDILYCEFEWIHFKLTAECLLMSCYVTWYYCSSCTGFLFTSTGSKTNKSNNFCIMNNLPRSLWLLISHPPPPLAILLLNISAEWPTWIGLEYLCDGLEQMSSNSSASVEPLYYICFFFLRKLCDVKALFMCRSEHFIIGHFHWI